MNGNLANPAPLGLMGFGMTTVLLNVHNAGFISLSAMILAMGLAYGGAAQVIAGILEFKKGNTFGLTAFTSYGFFWLSLVALLVLPKLGRITSYNVCYTKLLPRQFLFLWRTEYPLEIALQVLQHIAVPRPAGQLPQCRHQLLDILSRHRLQGPTLHLA